MPAPERRVWKAAIRRIAAQMPAHLADLRGKLMLAAMAETLGVVEVRCPACGGSGWLDRRALEPCPICNGFIEVPDRLADWFNARICNAAAERASSGDASAAAYHPMAERPGRLAEMTYRAHLPVE